jgi:hypothetical protein
MLLLGLALVALQNPSTIWCDVHNVNFVKMGTVIQNGKCYDLYKHSYNDGLKVKTHEALMACQ